MIEGFIACYSKSAGAHEWSYEIAGPADDEAEGIAIDRDGNLHLAASFDSDVAVAPGGPSAGSNGAEDGLVVGITPGRAHRYHFDFGGSSDDQAEGVAAGADLVAVAAYISGQADIEDGGEVLGGGGGGKNAILFATGLDGGYRWGRSLGSVGGDQITYDVAVDAAGNVYAAGIYEGTPDFGRGAVANQGARDAFLISYDPDGGLRWVVTFGGAGNDSLDGVTVDDRGHLYVAGRFEQTVDLAGEVLTSRGAGDAVLASFTSAGVLRWARSFGGTGEDFAGAVAAAAGRIHAVGGFAGTVDFGTGPVVAAGASDGLLLLLTEP
jgi:hypothetical protein